MTVPLVTKADGSKFGKTTGGSVWLDAGMTSPYSFYQFWLNMADADATDYLKFFTFLAEAEIEGEAEALRDDPSARSVQRKLASEVTRIVHGDDALTSALRITDALFHGKIQDLTETDLDQLRLDGIACTVLGEDNGILSVLAESGLVSSKGAARKLVASKGVRVNGDVVDDLDLTLTPSTALYGRYHLIRRGKKAWHLVAQAA